MYGIVMNPKISNQAAVQGTPVEHVPLSRLGKIWMAWPKPQVLFGVQSTL